MFARFNGCRLGINFLLTGFHLIYVFEVQDLDQIQNAHKIEAVCAIFACNTITVPAVILFRHRVETDQA